MKRSALNVTAKTTEDHKTIIMHLIKRSFLLKKCKQKSARNKNNNYASHQRNGLISEKCKRKSVLDMKIIVKQSRQEQAVEEEH